MGQKTSMNSSMNIVSNVFTSAMVKVSKSCSQQTIASQNVSASNVGGDVTFENISQSSSITINFECIQSSENQQTIMNDVKENVSAALKANSAGTLAANQSSVNSWINSVSNAVSMTDMQDFSSCAQSSWSIQNVSATNVAGNVTFKNVSQSMIMNITGKCLQSNTALVDATNKLDKVIGVEASAEASGVDPIGQFFAMIQNNMMISVGGVVACSLISMVGAVVMMGGGGGGGGPPA